MTENELPTTDSVEHHDNETANDTDKIIDQPTTTIEENIAPISANNFQEYTGILLRAPHAILAQITNPTIPHLPLYLVLFSALLLAGYGLIIGLFSGGDQFFYAPIKVALGTLATAILCIPSLFVLASLGGANITVRQCGTILLNSITTLVILLVGFAPIAFVFTYSVQTEAFMGVLHLLIWLVALKFAMNFVALAMRQYAMKDSVSIKIWCAVFVITLFQMSTTLRPIVGQSDQFLTPERVFFVEHWIKEISNESPTNTNQR